MTAADDHHDDEEDDDVDDGVQMRFVCSNHVGGQIGQKQENLQDIHVC